MSVKVLAWSDCRSDRCIVLNVWFTASRYTIVVGATRLEVFGRHWNVNKIKNDSNRHVDE